MKITLPASVSSMQDLNSLEIEIKEYAKWFHHNQIKERAHAKSTTPPPTLSSSAQELLKECSQKKLLTQENLDEIIKTLTKFKTSARTITITLAAPPPKSLKETLVGWCRKNIKADILVTFRFNSTILGGMVVQCGSHVYDWSFRRSILDAKQNFPEVLRRV